MLTHRRIKFIGLICIGLMVLAWAQPVSGQEDIIADYRTWTRLNAEPRNVGASLAMLCRLPSDDEQAFMESQHGSYYMNDYVNEIGLVAMTEESYPVFPAGTVIVKEKLGDALNTTPDALGIMIKHEAGYNASTGDWEYFYWEAPNTLLPDENNYCANCHLEAALTDSVYRPYLNFDPAFKLTILREKWLFDIQLGYEFDESQRILKDIPIVNPLDVISENDIESYDWAEQIITLTPEATSRLMSSLELTNTEDTYLNNMDLDNRIFIVELNGARLYGGTFTFGMSAKGLDFPTIYHQIENDRLMLAIRPSNGGLIPSDTQSYAEVNLSAERRARIEWDEIKILFERLQKS
jgi:Cytochrome P460